MQQARNRHNVIIMDESTVLVVGGIETRKTELCRLTGQKFSCTKQNPELNMNNEFCELFIVPEDFCQS